VVKFKMPTKDYYWIFPRRSMGLWLGVGYKQDDFVTSIGQLKSSLDTMISTTKHLAEKIVQCILVVGGVDTTRNEVA
jgi:hypothetical protein